MCHFDFSLLSSVPGSEVMTIDDYHHNILTQNRDVDKSESGLLRIACSPLSARGGAGGEFGLSSNSRKLKPDIWCHKAEARAEVTRLAADGQSVNGECSASRSLRSRSSRPKPRLRVRHRSVSLAGNRSIYDERPMRSDNNAAMTTTSTGERAILPSLVPAV
jgi:hypothetical protein